VATVRVDLSNATIKAVAVQELGKLVITTTLRIHNRAKILCPVDTGNLRASITQKITLSGEEIIGTVGTNVKYAAFVHDGTRPHTIRARAGKSLVFYWPKAGVVTVVPNPAKRWTGKFADGHRLMIGKGYVDHPGTKARPFLRTALVEEATKAGFIVKSV